MWNQIMAHVDWTFNVPTLLVGLGVLFKGWTFLKRLEYKINIMWSQFLLEHPDFERRERLNLL